MRGNPEEEANEILDPTLWVFREQMHATLMNHAVTAYLNGNAQMVEFGKTLTTNRPIFFEGPPMQQAIDYANKRCATMVTKMDAETKERLANVIGKAIKEKRGIDGLARDIRQEIDNMTESRSQLIARTETADALSAGSFDRMLAMGVDGKEWIRGSSDRCDICQGNADAGVIPIDKPFPSGHMRPPGHPACKCALAPAMLRGKGR